MSGRPLTFSEKRHICDALLSIAAFHDRDIRSLYLSEVERLLQHSINIRRFGDTQHDVWSMVTALLDHRGAMPIFVRTLELLQGRTAAAARLRHLLDELDLPDAAPETVRSSDRRQRVLEALLSLSALHDRDIRSLYLSEVENELNHSIDVKRYPDVVHDLWSLVTSLETHPRAMRLFVDVVKGFHGGQRGAAMLESALDELDEPESLTVVAQPVAQPAELQVTATARPSEPTGLPGREALCISLDSFEGWRALPFASQRKNALAAELARLGYRCRHLDGVVAAQDLGMAVRGAIGQVGPDQVLIVHVLSHGHISRSGALYIVGSDGTHHELTEVERWLRAIVDATAPAPLTLFLLDICSAGIAARLTWQTRIEGHANRAWVIAACAPDENAYNGRFTEAITNVLRDLADGKLDIDRALPNAPLATMAQKIRRDLDRLTAVAHAIPQQVTATLIDMSSDPLDLPFFPNPRYLENPRRVVRPMVDAAVTPFLDDLDEALDPSHFVRHALGRYGEQAGSGGCFSGRSRELKILAPWLNLQDDMGLRVLTGSPGVGKSALIGVLVCAAHPVLRKPTAAVWEHIEQAPYVNHCLAAVHARGRTLTDIAASIARQLGLDGPPIDAVARLTAPPVIVVDALDEAADPVGVMNELLVPLARIRYGDEPLRLLVGMRPWQEFHPLRELAGDGLLDLDQVPAERLRRDLQQYVSRLLVSDPRWDRIDTEGSAHTLARAVAEQLTSSESAPEWGAFLVAGLYTHHVLNAYPDAISDPAEAAQRGKRVPKTLPEVLELDLRTRDDKPWLLPILTAIAHARGEGMPASLIRHVSDAPDIETVLSALEDVRFYLRHSTETDGTALYRLFHQGLTDHLRQARDEHEVYASLLGSLVPDTTETKVRFHWHLAEPYLLRHALDHAPDPGILLSQAGFLVEADPAILLPRMDEPLRRCYLGFGPQPAGDPQSRRQLLALSAMYFRRPQLAKALVDLPGKPALETIPLWMASTIGRSPITAINTFTVAGTSWAIMGTEAGAVWLREIRGTQRSKVRTADAKAQVVAVAANGDQVAIALSDDRLIIGDTTFRHAVATLEFGLIGGNTVLMVNGDRLIDLDTKERFTIEPKWERLHPAVGRPLIPGSIDQVCTTPFGETVIRSGSTVIALVTSG